MKTDMIKMCKDFSFAQMILEKTTRSVIKSSLYSLTPESEITNKEEMHKLYKNG